MSETKELIEAVKGTDISEIRVEAGNFKFCVKRRCEPSADAAAPAPPPAPSAPKRVSVKSPMVGTFFNAPAPDRPPFVIKGNRVETSQKVGVIEAMKIYKDVLAPAKGVIAEVLVENNTPVEYGQELFILEPGD